MNRMVGCFGLMVCFVGGQYGSQADDGGRIVPIARWFAEQPTVGEGGETVYLPAPDWLIRETAEVDDKDGPANWLRVRIRLQPDAPKVWCQHAGAIAELEREIPPGQAFRVRFKARSISGARQLKVLRRWGGLTRPYWGNFTLADEWRDYSRVLRSEQQPTQWINFSVIDSERGGLRPLADGEFLIAEVSVTLVDEE